MDKPILFFFTSVLLSPPPLLALSELEASAYGGVNQNQYLFYPQQSPYVNPRALY